MCFDKQSITVLSGPPSINISILLLIIKVESPCPTLQDIIFKLSEVEKTESQITKAASSKRKMVTFQSLDIYDLLG